MKKRNRLLIAAILVICISTIAHAQWTSSIGAGAINTLFTNGNDLLAGFNGNGGTIVVNNVNWSYAGTGIPSGTDVRAFGANSLYVFAGTQSGLFRCNNDGNYNWNLVLSGGYWSILVVGNEIFAGTLGAGLFHSTDNGNTWTSTTSGMELYPHVYALASNSSYLFAGMYAGNGIANSPDAGVYRSSDNGLTWTQKINGLSNHDVFSLLIKDNYIFAGTNGGIFRSGDNGETWTYVAGGSVHSLKLVCGTDIYAGLLNGGGVSYSTDDGNTWTGDGMSYYAVTSLSILNNHLYAATPGAGVFKSEITCATPNGSICGMKFNDLNGDGIQDINEPGIQNWVINLKYQNAAGFITIMDTTDANGNYCFNDLQPGGTYTVFETNQSGWTQTYPASPGTYTILLASGENKDSVNFGNYFVSSSSSTCVDFEDNSLNGGSTLNALQSIKTYGENHYFETTDQAGPTALYFENNKLMGDWTQYLDGGCGSLCWDVNYFFAGVGNDGSSQPITFLPAIRIYGNGFSAYFVTNNLITAGDGWHSYCAPISFINPGDSLPSNSEGHWVIDIGTVSDWNSLLTNITQIRFSIDPTSYQNEVFGFDNICLNNTGDCATGDSSNACINWSLMNDESVSSISGNVNASAEVVSSGSSAPFMVIFNPYTTDGQRLITSGGWLAGSLDPSKYIEFKASPNPGNNFTVNNISFNYGDNPQTADFNIIKSEVFYSTDNFSSSTSLGGVLSYLNLSMSAFNGSNLSINVPDGQMFSLRIYPYSPTGSVTTTISLAIHNNVNICGTTSPVTSVENESVISEIPVSFQLKQNFPNPFNPTTVIQYEIPKMTYVKISVYDILGSEVQVLVNEEKAPGQYNVVFDAKNLSSGIYFYSIKTNEFNQMKKLILLK